MAYWNPFVKAMVSSIAATLMIVAAMARRMMKRENDLSRLKAIRRAIKAGTFKEAILNPKNSYFWQYLFP